MVLFQSSFVTPVSHMTVYENVAVISQQWVKKQTPV